MVSGIEDLTGDDIIKVMDLKTPNKTREKSLFKSGKRITQNYDWLLEVLRSDEFRPSLRNFLRFVTASGAITYETFITVELRKPSEMIRNAIPEAQTCFSTVYMPDEPYDSREVLFERLELCCGASTGFGNR